MMMAITTPTEELPGRAMAGLLINVRNGASSKNETQFKVLS
jgi:hypothetical protein